MRESKIIVQFVLWTVTFFLLLTLFGKLVSPVKTFKTSDELEQAIEKGQVESMVVDPITYKISGNLKLFTKEQIQYKFKATAIGPVHMDKIRELAEKKGIPVVALEPPNPMYWILFNILLFVLLPLGFFYYLMKKQTGGKDGPFGFGKSKAKRFYPDKDRKVFADVAGCEEAKQEVQEIVEFLKNPGEFSRLGARIPKGILLYGKPGTGKTLLARAVAGEAGVPFLSANGSKFIEMFVGVGASRVRDLFETARKLSPCVIFIDEIDAVGQKRGAAIYGSHDEGGQTLNALLEELDGFEANAGIIVMAATNRPDVLDEALVRPGRFDRQIQVPSPDLHGRELILKVHTKNKKIDPSVDLLHIAKDTVGMVGADLENVVNEAVLIATRKKKITVDQSDFSEAVDKVSMGPMRKSVKLSEKEKKTTAYHEAGHTLVAMLNPKADPVHKVTIIPRGPALGFTKQLPDADRHSITKSQLEAMVEVCVGGRAAEELIMGEITTGHSNDFEKATEILRNMINRFGMSEEAGMAVYKDKTDFFGNAAGLDASQKTKELLENVLRDKLEETYKKVKKLLADNTNKLVAIANALLEKETLEAKDLDLIMQSF